MPARRIAQEQQQRTGWLDPMQRNGPLTAIEILRLQKHQFHSRETLAGG